MAKPCRGTCIQSRYITSPESKSSNKLAVILLESLTPRGGYLSLVGLNARRFEIRNSAETPGKVSPSSKQGGVSGRSAGK